MEVLDKISDSIYSDSFLRQRNFFRTGNTLDYATRKEALLTLRKAIKSYEETLMQALATDMGKSPFEAYAAEIGILYEEIDLHLKKLKSWMKPKSVGVNQLVHFFSRGYIQSQPYGNCLIIAPWNYPVQLSLSPLIGALSAGNTAIIKPSEFTPTVADAIQKMLSENFKEEYVKVFCGGPEVSQTLMELHWDKIFFTGSPRVGSIIMKKAAEKLIPITLELGGKSPCIVSNKANLKVAAKRIVWGKMLNAGQTCIAPDHLYVHENVKDAFVTELIHAINELYGKDPIKSKDLAKIVNTHHYQRVSGYLINGKILYGGNTAESDRKIAPTLLEVNDLNQEVMQEEIFGPILPILTYQDLKKWTQEQKRLEKPLAFYFFSDDKQEQDYIIKHSSSGCMAINEVIMQVAANTLPFGGVGRSGMGNYHGEASFDCFSHKRSILKKSVWPDIPLRYPPYNDKIKWVKMIFK